MRVLTLGSKLACGHGGRVRLTNRQSWVQAEGCALLVEDDPHQRTIDGCPMQTPTTPRCTLTIRVDERLSYSALVRIDGRRLCLDTTTGRTNWSLLDTTPFGVADAGQSLVSTGA